MRVERIVETSRYEVVRPAVVTVGWEVETTIVPKSRAVVGRTRHGLALVLRLNSAETLKVASTDGRGQH